MVFSRTVSPPKSFLPVAASAAARFAAADRCCETRGGREGFAHRDIDDALFLGGARVASPAEATHFLPACIMSDDNKRRRGHGSLYLHGSENSLVRRPPHPGENLEQAGEWSLEQLVRMDSRFCAAMERRGRAA